MRKIKNDFTALCLLSQEELKTYLHEQLTTYYADITTADGFLYCAGDAPIMLTAHLDTVHREHVRTVRYSRGCLSSPQGIGGDDRAGVFAIMHALPDMERLPHLLFCEDEETGCIGSRKFTRAGLKPDIRHIVGLDRKGNNDAVFYDCGNDEYKDYILALTGFKEASGSFTDICELSPSLDVASVNLSVGYYDQHTTQERVNLREMVYTSSLLPLLVADSFNQPRYTYDEIAPTYNGALWRDTLADPDVTEWEIYALTKKGKPIYDTVLASDYVRAIGLFLMEHPHLHYNDIQYCDNLWR